MSDWSTAWISAKPAWYRPMVARSAQEEHRAATPLELLLDLCFVVAVALAAASLHHALSAGRWLIALALPIRWGLVAFPVLALAELLVPVWAERAAPTAWRPHHIAERYGLFTLIVLGESVLAATTAIQAALDAGQATLALGQVAASGLVIVFGLWRLYFATPHHQLPPSRGVPFIWGMGTC